MFGQKFDLIVTIVNKGLSDTVVEAAKAAGARGATIIQGKGSGIEGVVMLFEVAIEPEKDIVLCVVPENICEDVVASITVNAALERLGAGIAFVLPLKSVVGISTEDKKSELE